MKIVIDINEHIYEQIMADSEVYVLDNEADRILIENAIYNSTPLPEHHGRLIDADTLEEKVEKHRNMLKISEYDRELVLHYTDIEIAPTIIEAEGSESE